VESVGVEPVMGFTIELLQVIAMLCANPIFEVQRQCQRETILCVERDFGPNPAVIPHWEKRVAECVKRSTDGRR
jgi:hypothetical protein